MIVCQIFLSTLIITTTRDIKCIALRLDLGYQLLSFSDEREHECKENERESSVLILFLYKENKTPLLVLSFGLTMKRNLILLIGI